MVCRTYLLSACDIARESDESAGPLSNQSSKNVSSSLVVLGGFSDREGRVRTREAGRSKK
jgi:hypothetical protein